MPCLVALIASSLIAAPPTPRVLIVGIDGLRPDAAMAADAPTLHALMKEGCWTDRAMTGPITVSGPGWSSFLCGVWHDKHGSIDNNFRGVRYDTFPHFFARLLEKKPDAVTIHIADWVPIDRYILGRTPVTHRFAVEYKDDGDAKCVADAKAALASIDADITFFYFADVDETGHAHGFHTTVPEYMREIEEVDSQLGSLLAVVRARPRFADEDWLIIVTSDHSGTIDGSHGRDEPDHREMLFIAHGSRMKRGELRETINQVDVAPTALAYLGITPDRAWDFDGRAVAFEQAVPLGRNLVFNGDGEHASGRRDQTTYCGVPGWTDLGPMTVIEYDATGGFPTTSGPGPEYRGRNFFCGGTTKGQYPGLILNRSEMTQEIDLRTITDLIDSGDAAFEFSAFLGGYLDQRDLMWADVVFLDDRKRVISSHRIAPVSVNDRVAAFGAGEAATGLMRRATIGDVPIETRSAVVRLVAEAASGESDGYADNVSLMIHHRTPGK